MSLKWEWILKNRNAKWRPEYVSNENARQISKVISALRENYRKAPHGSEQKRAIAKYFNTVYSNWSNEMEKANEAKRAKTTNFVKTVISLKRTGNTKALAAFLNSFNQKPQRVIRPPPPQRSGKSRNTSSPLKYMMALKAKSAKQNIINKIRALEIQRNAIEAQLNNLRREQLALFPSNENLNAKLYKSRPLN